MPKSSDTPDAEKAAQIVYDAGGEVVGRTRLQKMTYLLEVAQQGAGFPFEYRHYGPYSEALSELIQLARIGGLIEEQEETANWGGRYSIYTSKHKFESQCPKIRQSLLKEMSKADAVELELAATAAFFKAEGVTDPWGETARRKPHKAGNGRLDKAKVLYQRLLEQSEGSLPQLK